MNYGILFVLLPFLVFFLFEVFSGRKVRAMHYLLVGFATSGLTAFYAGFAPGDRRRWIGLSAELSNSYLSDRLLADVDSSRETGGSSMNPVVHFELPAEDAKRMSGFYTRAFGWQTKQLGPEMGNYVLVRTTETAENGFPKEPGRINGGFAEKSKDFQHPSLVIGVADIHEAMKQVAAAGGKVLGGQKSGQPDDIPGVGFYSAFVDTEGNRLGMLQPKDMTEATK